MSQAVTWCAMQGDDRMSLLTRMTRKLVFCPSRWTGLNLQSSSAIGALSRSSWTTSTMPAHPGVKAETCATIVEELGSMLCHVVHTRSAGLAPEQPLLDADVNVSQGSVSTVCPPGRGRQGIPRRFALFIDRIFLPLWPEAAGYRRRCWQKIFVSQGRAGLCVF